MDWKKNIEDSIKDALIITATTTGIFFVLKAGKRKTAKGISEWHGYHEPCRWNLRRDFILTGLHQKDLFERFIENTLCKKKKSQSY